MRVYVAGPYGDSNPKEVIAQNVRNADAVGRSLMAVGHEVYIPHTMSWGWEDDVRLSRSDFFRLDKSFLDHWAEGIVRLPGHSRGADWEMEYAASIGLAIL